jgi:hypothetical protein
VELEEVCAELGGEFQGKGTTCDPNPCGCVTDDDCCTTGYQFTYSGTTYGPYDTRAECETASTATCGPPPTCPCFCSDIDPYCCSGSCQSEPCDPP